MKNTKIQIPNDAMPSSQIPLKGTNSSIWERVALYQLIYSIAGLIVGVLCVVLGVVLLFYDVGLASTSWSTKFLGGENNITNAAPGIILATLGLFVILATRFSIKTK